MSLFAKSHSPKKIVVPFRIDKEEEVYLSSALAITGENMSAFCREAVGNRVAQTIAGAVVPAIGREAFDREGSAALLHKVNELDQDNLELRKKLQKYARFEMAVRAHAVADRRVRPLLDILGAK